MRLLPFFLLIHATPALAAENTGPDLMTSVLKLAAGLIVVLGLMLLVYALSRKGLNVLPGTRGGAGRQIRVMEMRSLGPKKALYLVEVAGEQMLLGAGAERIELITRLEKKSAEFQQTLQNQIDRSS